MPSPRRLLVALLLLAGLVGPTAAHASSTMQTGMADDRLLLQSGPQVAARTVDEMQRLGVQTVRLHVRWVAVTPDPNARTRPAGFDPRDPDDPGYNWAALDDAVRLLGSAKIAPILAITGSGPTWSSRVPSRGQGAYKPDPEAYGDFVHAVVARYGARTAKYLVWNEPNQTAWLKPQFSCTGGRCTPVAPHLYRDLVQAALGEIRAGDPSAKVYAGTMSPIGNGTAVMSPLRFLRAFACLTASGNRDRTGPCRTARTMSLDGISWHPHPVRATPTSHASNTDDATIGDLGRMEAQIDAAVAKGLLRKAGTGRMPLELTEFGYQTDPPDPISGVTPAQQAARLQQSWYLAWHDPRVQNITQYELTDEPTRPELGEGREFEGWQSGLRFFDGTRKPSYSAFARPFWVDVRRGRRDALVWGQVRPGSGPIRVRVLRGFSVVATLTTNGAGFFSKLLPVTAKATWHFEDADGRSRSQTVAPLRPR